MRVKILLVAFLLLMQLLPCRGTDDGDVFRKAVRLYDEGLYSSALDLFQGLPQAGDDPLVDGYSVLCAQKMKICGYEALVDEYLKEYPSGMLKNAIVLERSLDFFDLREYDRALELFRTVRSRDLTALQKAEFFYKLSYCQFHTGNSSEAMTGFLKVGKMGYTDYSAPSWYCMAYILYGDGKFSEALELFDRAAQDERFAIIASYYSVICHYQLHEYDKVIENGRPLYEDVGVDAQRKNYLARMISESYLVLGDKEKASEYYAMSGDEGKKSRADHFYAGCLMYATEDYQGAIDNYKEVVSVQDSLSQISWYNMALSFIKLKNKVSALDAFRNAANVEYDLKMTEDAFFNWAKLAFDINRDGSVFERYLARWSDKVRGEKIYSYMALSALSDKDWQGAIDNLDKIENLSDNDENNYVRANYLRACQLFDNGAYRSSIPYFQNVSFLTSKDDRLNQLSRLYNAMSLYRDGQFRSAVDIFTALYNSSALIGMSENVELPYNVAYSCMQDGDYDAALKWFSVYLSGEEVPNRKDAMTRLADCRQMAGDYEAAADAYGEVHKLYPGADDIYPYYYRGICLGLAKKGAQKLAVLKEVLSANPAAPLYSEALFELAKAYGAEKKVNDAAKTCRKLIANSPDSTWKARGLLELATIKRNAGFPEAAMKYYKQVVEKYSSTIYCEDALLAVESLYRKMKKPGQYLTYLESIGRGKNMSDEEKQDLFFGAAEQYFRVGDNAGAVVAFKDFCDNFPSSARKGEAEYYMARSYEKMSDKVRACDFYRSSISSAEAVTSGTPDYVRDAWGRSASLYYGMGDFAQAETAYGRLLSSGGDPLSAVTGMMRCRWCLKEFEAAVSACDSVLSLAGKDASLKRQAKLIKARSLMSSSRREEALPVFENLCREARTQEGAQATLALVRHYFDAADYNKVSVIVKDFASSGTEKEYYLAECFIILGDSYVEQGRYKQAKATFQSISDGYSGAGPDVSDPSLYDAMQEGVDIRKEVTERLNRLKDNALWQ